MCCKPAADGLTESSLSQWWERLQSPMQTQQNSYLHLQVMCMQPPFFWMLTLHFGHGLVFFKIHDCASKSSALTFDHSTSNEHSIGSWDSSWHLKQKKIPQSQRTDSRKTELSNDSNCTARWQFAFGHHFMKRLFWKINNSPCVMTFLLIYYLHKVVGDNL